MEEEVGKKALECILLPAMLAAKNVRAQRDRLLELRRRLQQQQRTPGVQEVAADLFKVYATGLRAGGGYLSTCLEIAYENDADLSFTNPAFAFIPDDQLYHTLLSQRLPARPKTQTDAFTRIELAYYAVNLPAAHHIPRCIEFLVGVRPPSNAGKNRDCMAGYADDTVAAATDHIYKTRFPDMPRPGDADFDAAERIPRTRPSRSTHDLEVEDTAEDSAAALTWEPPQVASSKDPDQALSYLHRACSLVSLAVKHIDLAVAVISSFLDPKEVAEISDMADEDADISESEDEPNPSD